MSRFTSSEVSVRRARTIILCASRGYRRCEASSHAYTSCWVGVVDSRAGNTGQELRNLGRLSKYPMLMCSPPQTLNNLLNYGSTQQQHLMVRATRYMLCTGLRSVGPEAERAIGKSAVVWLGLVHISDVRARAASLANSGPAADLYMHANTSASHLLY